MVFMEWFPLSVYGYSGPSGGVWEIFLEDVLTKEVNI